MGQITSRHDSTKILYSNPDLSTRGELAKAAFLSSADLSAADLSHADLSHANLRSANLSAADLRSANLSHADLIAADLSAAKIDPIVIATTSITPETGSFEGWKKCRNGAIVRLEIPADARRSNATGRKCRAERAKVIEVIGADVGISTYDHTTIYRTGEMATCHLWDEDRWQECSGGIHFFITRLEAERYEI